MTPPADCTISSYTVYGGTAANPTTLVATVTSGTSYTNTGLASSTLYYYVVKAVDSDGASAGPQRKRNAHQRHRQMAIVSINAGGAAVSNSAGGDNSFVADEDSAPAEPPTRCQHHHHPRQVLTRSPLPQPFTSQRGKGVSTYTIPGLTAGTNYTVRLHFAELYFSGGRRS